MEAIIRPMYKTDENFIKGMYVAILDGKIVKRHTDLGKLGGVLDKHYPKIEFRILLYDEIDKELAWPSVTQERNLKAFEIMGWSQYHLIAKVLYDNGIKTTNDYNNWLKTVNKNLPQYMTVNVFGAIRDFEINFVDPKIVPNIFKL